ncbi:MAG: NAD-dependent epimerase/dehydratase family protein [Anaeromyxobacteraceae bacterium]
MSAVLVTGATGFVGRAIARRLVSAGHPVRASTRGAPIDVAGVEALRLDADSGPERWRAAMEGIEAVVHAAARVHVLRDDAPEPLAAYRKVNVAWTEQLARCAAAAGARRFVLLSSVKVMGEGRAAPYTEDDRLAPCDPYGVSKVEAEAALARVAAETGLEHVSLRPPLVYGPGVKANFARLMGAVARGVPLPLGAVENRRSLVYVENLADAVRVAVEGRGTAGAWLVSDGESVSTPELVRRIAGVMGRAPRLLPIPPWALRAAAAALGRRPTADRLLGSLAVDGGRFRRDFGWTPPFTLDEGLRATAAWWATQRAMG